MSNSNVGKVVDAGGNEVDIMFSPVEDCRGSVLWFSATKGYGFVEVSGLFRDGKPLQAFLHYKNIEGHGYKNAREDDNVRFTLQDDGRGPIAKNVIILTG